MKRLVEGLESTFGVTCEFEFKRIIRLYNDPEFTQYVAQTIKEADADDIQGIEVCEPQPPSEDFAFYRDIAKYIFIQART